MTIWQKGAEKWSRDPSRNCIDTYRYKNSLIPNMQFFDLRRKITKLSQKNRFRTLASTDACGQYIGYSKESIESRK